MNAFNETVASQLEQIAKRSNLKNYTISLESIPEKGGNYLGTLYFITISGENETEPKNLQIVVKCVEIDKTDGSFVDMKRPFENEAYCYQTILKAFENLQNVLPPREKFRSFPKCLAASIDGNKHKVLIFEDLRKSGFVLHDRMEPMDEDHLTLVLEELGRLHALSFVFREKNPNGFEDMASKLDLVLKHSKIQVAKIEFAAYEKCKRALIDLGYEEYVEEFERIEEFLEENFSLGNCEEQYSVICHGDAWCNNLMFKYDVSSKRTPELTSRADFVFVELQ